MFAANLVKYLSRRTGTASCDIVQTLTDAFLGVGPGGKIEKALIGFSILHNGSGFSIDCEHYRAFGLLELFHEIAGRPAKRRQRLDVTGDVKHLHLHD
jgi:hypothetical protein